MDPEFMTRYLSQPEHEPTNTDGAPVSEPDVGEACIDEPSAGSIDAPREDPTAVLAPDVVTPLRSAPAAQPGPPPQPVQPFQPRAAHLPAERAHSDTSGAQAAAAPDSTPIDAGTAAPARSEAAAALSEQRQAPHAWTPGDHRYVPPRQEGAQHGRVAPAQGSAAPPPSGPRTGPQPAVAHAAPARHGGPGWDEPGIAASGWTAPATQLRPDELVKKRTLPPEMGWRKAVYVATGHLVNLGAGPAERHLRDQTSLIGSNIPGNYSVAFVSIKGGVGKTRTAAGVGTVYATYRTEPVVAMDANPTYGSLGRVIDVAATASIREFVSDEDVTTYPKARSYTGKNQQGLEVLAGNQNVANPLVLSQQLFTDTLDAARRFYQLSLIDCGNHIEHPVMRAVLGSVDALVIVSTMNYDGAEAAEKTIDWLAVRNMGELLRRSVLVLNDVNDCYNAEFVTKVRERLEPRVGAAKLVPFDKHLRDGAELDFGALRRRTQLAYIDLGAWLAQGFAAPRAGL